MWSTRTVDEQRGLLFAGLGDANRPGPEGTNLYTGCIVALDAATGKLKWFHQLVHHDIWDFDLPTPPLLIDFRRNGRTIPAVLQTGKMNLVFIFNRETGEPLYATEERRVPQSEDASTFTSPVGGPNWGPLSYNPQLGYVFINLHNSGVYRAAGSAARGAGADDQPAGAPQGRGRGGQPGGGGPNGRVGGPLSYVLKNGA